MEFLPINFYPGNLKCDTGCWVQNQSSMAYMLYVHHEHYLYFQKNYDNSFHSIDSEHTHKGKHFPPDSQH